MKKLSQIVELIGGYSFKSELYTNNGIRVVRITNVQDGYFVDDNPCYYDQSIVAELGKANLKENDLLMSLTGNVGRVAFLPKNMLPAGLNQRVECLRTDDMLIKRYLYYFFRSNRFISDAVKNATGVAQLNMSTKWLANYQIPEKARSKMGVLVDELDKISSLIKKSEEEICLFDELIKSRFNEMFSKIICSGERETNFGSICDGIIGLTYKPDNISDEGTIVLRSGNIQNNSLQIIDDVVRVSNINIPDEKMVRDLDILMCARNGSARLVGKTCIIRKPTEKMTFGAFMTIIRTKYPYILHHYMNSDFFRIQLKSTQTASVNQITNGMLKKYNIFSPTEAEEKQFRSFVEQIDKLKFSCPLGIEPF